MYKEEVTSVKNRYNHDVTTEKKQRKSVINELLKPFGKKDLVAMIREQMPINGLFRMVSSDTDLSKLSTTERIRYLRDNPDSEEAQV